MDSHPTVNQICQYCRRKPHTVLKKCHRCRGVSYCSSLCQQEDWKNHHRACRVAQEGSKLPSFDYLKTEEEKRRLAEILMEIYSDLAKWMESQSGLLLSECINGMDLENNPRNCEKYVLRVVVSHNPQRSRKSKASDLFTVTKVEVMGVKYAEQYMFLWKDCMQELAVQRREAKARGMGLTAAVGIECPALATVRMLQFSGVGKYFKLGRADTSSVCRGRR